jgi:hypothetical protein
MRIAAAFSVGILAALLALPACSNKRHPTGSANLSVRTPAVGIDGMVATVRGPAMPSARTYPLSARGNSGTWQSLLDSLPVGSDYLVEVAGQSSGGSRYRGSALGITIVKAQVPAVAISARRAEAVVPGANVGPIIDSLVLSSTYVLPEGSTTVQATAHDPDANDTLTFAWSASPSGGVFLAPSAAETDWTAPSMEGDQTLVVRVTDSRGAATSASVVVHVTATPEMGQTDADVEVTFNDGPVVANLLVVPGTLTAGSSVALVATASDGDGDALSYAWTSTCAGGTFSSTTASATSFTLPSGTTDASCDLVVAVSDGRGGSTNGLLTVPVGNPPVIEAPTITGTVQSVHEVDVNGSVNLSLDASDPQGGALTFQWVAAAGTFSNQVDGNGGSHVTWTAPATADTDFFTVSAIVTDSLGASVAQDFPISASGSGPPTPVAVPVPRFASWLLAGALALAGAIVMRRPQRRV